MKVWKTRLPQIEFVEDALNKEAAAGWEVFSVSQPILLAQPLGAAGKQPFVLITFYKVT